MAVYFRYCRGENFPINWLTIRQFTISQNLLFTAGYSSFAPDCTVGSLKFCPDICLKTCLKTLHERFAAFPFPHRQSGLHQCFINSTDNSFAFISDKKMPPIKIHYFTNTRSAPDPFMTLSSSHSIVFS
jgi:hypothetical protein